MSVCLRGRCDAEQIEGAVLCAGGGGEDGGEAIMPDADDMCRHRLQMLFWALMASGQITLRKVDGWKTLRLAPAEQSFDQAA